MLRMTGAARWGWQQRGVAFAIALLAACTPQGEPTEPAGDEPAQEPAEQQPEPLAKSAARAKEAAEKPRSNESYHAPERRRQLVESRSHTLAIEQLQALGYVDGTYDPQSEKSGVLLHRKAKTQRGYNFYSSRKSRGADLIDMDGELVHRWRTSRPGAWQHSELLPNGDVIVIVKDRELARYDKHSRLVWAVRGRFHHDLWVDDQEIYVLSRVARVLPYMHPKAPVLDDLIQVYSLEGNLRRELSVLDALHQSAYGFLLPSVSHARVRKGRQLDVLHTNHVEVLDGSFADRDPAFAEGNLLVSMRNINAIAILDPETASVVWIWGPTNLTFQHHPTFLENGRILLFDNGVDRSRVIELDPESRRIVWQYAPGPSFFSQTRGSNQRLPNGNTLITESDRGYVLEVTRRREVVWKFANPRVNKKSEREAIWRMTRVDPKSLTFLDPPARPPSKPRPAAARSAKP